MNANFPFCLRIKPPATNIHTRNSMIFLLLWRHHIVFVDLLWMTVKYIMYSAELKWKKLLQNKTNSPAKSDMKWALILCSVVALTLVSTGNAIITHCPLTNIVGDESKGKNVPFRKGSAQFHYFHTCRKQLQFSLQCLFYDIDDKKEHWFWVVLAGSQY